MSLNVLDDVVAIQRQREAAASEAYGKLVSQLASGSKKPSATSVDEVLTAARKTVDELAADVKVVVRKQGLREQIAAAESADASRRPEIESEIKAADEVLAEAQRVHAATIKPLRFERDMLVEQMAKADRARVELRDLMSDEEHEAVQMAGKELEQLAREKDAASRHLREMISRKPTRSADSRDGWRSTADMTIDLDTAEYEAGVQRAEARLQAADEAASIALAKQNELLAKATIG